MGRARGGNALLEYKGGHEVGDGAFQRLSLDAAHSKVEVAASVAGTRLPNQTKNPDILGGLGAGARLRALAGRGPPLR